MTVRLWLTFDLEGPDWPRSLVAIGNLAARTPQPALTLSKSKASKVHNMAGELFSPEATSSGFAVTFD